MDTRTGIHKHGKTIHDPANDLTAAYNNRYADQQTKNYQQEMSASRTGNSQYIINPHRGVGNDNGLDRPRQAVCSIDLLRMLARCEQFNRNRQENQATDSLQIRNRQQPYGHEGHHQTNHHSPCRTDINRFFSQMVRQLIRSHRNNNCIIACQHKIQDNNRAQCHQKFHR